MNTSTFDYRQFKTAKGNREINEAHLKKLIAAIGKKNLLHLNPIIVDAEMNVIDGQHRLAAARKLKVPVFYIVDSGINEGDIAALNTNKRNWTGLDYVNYYAEHNNSHYKKLRSMIMRHGNIPAPAIIQLCTTDVSVTSLLRDGGYVCNNAELAEMVIKEAAIFEKGFNQWNSSKFLLALAHVIDSGEYNSEQMVMQLERQPGKLRLAANKEQYIELVEEIFNFRKVGGANFRLSKAARVKIEKKRSEDMEKARKEGAKQKELATV